MTRTSFRNLWFFVIFILLVTAFFIFRKSQEVQISIERAQSQHERLTRDLQAGAQLSAALARLDSLTIDENKATRLDILRHLGLEKTDLNFTVSAKSEKKIGRTRLFARQFTLSGELPYALAMEQIDWLHSTKKTAINQVVLENPGNAYGDIIKFRVRGTLYGLDKKGRGKRR